MMTMPALHRKSNNHEIRLVQNVSFHSRLGVVQGTRYDVFLHLLPK